MQPKTLSHREGGLICPGGQGTAHELPLNATSLYLYSLAVVQTAGTPVAFDVEVFEMPPAFASASASDSIGPDTGTLPPSLFQPVPAFSGTAGGVARFDAVTAGCPALVCPAQPTDPEPTGRSRSFWLKITPQGVATDNEFAVAYRGARGQE